MGAAGTWRGFRIVLAACAVTALGCGSAQAATTTIGSALGPPSGNPASGVARTWAIAPSAGSTGTQSPVDGTVISWSFRGSATGLYRPRILRPADGGAYRAVLSGDAQAGAGTVTPAGPFATALPIAAGDLFAVDVPAGRVLSYTAMPTATSIGWNPPLLDGGAGSPPTDTDEGEERQVAATVRYCLVPKLKGKAPKRAKAALRAADCKVGKVKRAKKATRKRKVLSQSAKPGMAISDTQAVNIRVSRKG